MYPTVGGRRRRVVFLFFLHPSCCNSISYISTCSHRKLEPSPIKMSATLELLKLNKQGISLYLTLTYKAIRILSNRSVQTKSVSYCCQLNSLTNYTLLKTSELLLFPFPIDFFSRSSSHVLNMSHKHLSLPHSVWASSYKPFTLYFNISKYYTNTKIQINIVLLLCVWHFCHCKREGKNRKTDEKNLLHWGDCLSCFLRFIRACFVSSQAQEMSKIPYLLLF